MVEDEDIQLALGLHLGSCQSALVDSIAAEAVVAAAVEPPPPAPAESPVLVALFERLMGIDTACAPRCCTPLPSPGG